MLITGQALCIRGTLGKGTLRTYRPSRVPTTWDAQWGGALSASGGLGFTAFASYDGWEGCCLICGVNLELACTCKISTGWHCDKDLFSTGIWLMGVNTNNDCWFNLAGAAFWENFTDYALTKNLTLFGLPENMTNTDLMTPAP